LERQPARPLKPGSCCPRCGRFTLVDVWFLIMADLLPWVSSCDSYLVGLAGV